MENPAQHTMSALRQLTVAASESDTSAPKDDHIGAPISTRDHVTSGLRAELASERRKVAALEEDLDRVVLFAAFAVGPSRYHDVLRRLSPAQRLRFGSSTQAAHLERMFKLEHVRDQRSCDAEALHRLRQDAERRLRLILGEMETIAGVASSQAHNRPSSPPPVTPGPPPPRLSKNHRVTISPMISSVSSGAPPTNRMLEGADDNPAEVPGDIAEVEWADDGDSGRGDTHAVQAGPLPSALRGSRPQGNA